MIVLITELGPRLGMAYTCGNLKHKTNPIGFVYVYVFVNMWQPM